MSLLASYEALAPPATSATRVPVSGLATSTSANSSAPPDPLHASQPLLQSTTASVTNNEESGTGLHCALIDLTQKERSGGESVITQTSHFKRPRIHDDRFSSYALQVLRRLNQHGQSLRTELVVHSPHLQKALREILSSYAFYNLAADPIVIAKPYAPIFHYRKELMAYAEAKERSDEERAHLKVLDEEFYKPYLGEVERIFTEEIPKGRVRFEYLWTLFRAEDDIVHHTEHFREVHRVMHCEEVVRGDDEYFHLYTWRWGYNAGKFGPCSETIVIPKFSSTREISQLLCFPIKLLAGSEQDAIYGQLIERGRKWMKLMKSAFRSYDGPMWVRGENSVANTMSALEILYTSGRVVLDHELHCERHPYLNDQLIGVHGYRLNGREVPGHLSSSAFLAIRGGSDGSTRITTRSPTSTKIIFNQAQCYNEDEYEMTGEEAILCPARTRGFSLSEKTFAFFLVDKLTPVDFQESTFDSLVLRQDAKRTIRALVETHDSGIEDFDDIVAGKGRGVIMSLEGPPGSGKTLTAESIAELTHRPLYSISTSEIGTEAKVAENGLKAIFRRAKRWRAVVLLDEADLFLVQRSVGDLDRNALVTVFLRTLEYFQGIMFMTTNRVQDFDQAFSSRIHLRIPFDDPTADTRSKIWKNLVPKEWSKSTCDELAKLELNGREIKNLIRTSTLIAKWEKKQLSQDVIMELHATYHSNHANGANGDKSETKDSEKPETKDGEELATEGGKA